MFRFHKFSCLRIIIKFAPCNMFDCINESYPYCFTDPCSLPMVYKTVNYVFTMKLLFNKLNVCFAVSKISVYSLSCFTGNVTLFYYYESHTSAGMLME